MPTATRTRPKQTNGAKRAGPIRAATAAAILPLAISLIPSTAPATGGACGTYCAKERWAVKTLSDGDALNITMTAQPTTVSALVAQTAPTVGSNDRIAPLETQLYTVNANLLGYREEADHDFHLVIQDPNSPNDRMIVEIPDPACSGVCSSIARDQITTARSAFATAFAASPPKDPYVALVQPVPVTITGVPLFDFFHRQVGVARNCIEIHPVIAIVIPPDRSLAVVPGHEPPAYPAHSCMPEVSDTED